MIHTLSIDLETRSGADLKKTGVYKYTEDPGFAILLFGFSADGGPVRVIDLARNEQIPEAVLRAIISPETAKWAFNASFERICLSAWLRKHRPDLFTGAYLSPRSWYCSMTWAATLGLPLSLEGAGSVLNLENQKLTEGKALIRRFCLPQRDRTRIRPEDDPPGWETFKEYNQRDVEAEMQIQEKLKRFPVPDRTWDEYHLSETINDRGILLDIPLTEQAIRLDALARDELSEEMQELTAIDNPNSAQQMKHWLKEHGLDTETLDKKAVQRLIRTAPEPLRKPLLLRQQLSRSSVRKYIAMKNCVCADGRCRGMFLFCGAPRSGRWAGRLIQLQNLPQNRMPDLKEARALTKNGDYEMLRLLYEDVPDTLSQLIRTAFIPKPGHQFIVADFSAIEARVIACLAQETWRIDAFRNNRDIYCASAEAMFKVPVEKHGINGHLRQKGKIAELALGYGGGTGALISMSALEMGLKEEELRPLVTAWREASPNIVSFWRDVDEAAKDAIRTQRPRETHGIRFHRESNILFITLPSQRKLAYPKPEITISRFGTECISYEGMTPNKKWDRIESFGPKLTENIVQAIARDILAYAMQNLRDYPIVAHIHDEVIIEAPKDTDPGTICTIMSQTPPWLPGLPLKAEGYEAEWYRKE